MVLHAEQPGDEGTLVRAAQRGDGEAFAELFRRHYPAVHRACSRRLSDPVEADEVAQAAFVRAYERIEQCAGDRRFGPWVHVIARSLCMDAFRAQARVEPWEEPPTGRRDHRPNEPEESVLSRERAAQVHEALASLPDSQRRAVVARDWDELRPGEIADRLGLSVGAVDSLLLRGRRRLALAYRRLAGEGGGGASVLPVRSAAATIGVALAVAPQAVMAGTAAAAQAVQQGASKAAGGVVSAVVSLALGMSGEAPSTPAPPIEAPAAVTAVVTLPEQAPLPPTTVVQPAREASQAKPPAPVTVSTSSAASEPATAAAADAEKPVTSTSTTVPAPAWTGHGKAASVAPPAPEVESPPPTTETREPGPPEEVPSTSPPATPPVVEVEVPDVPVVPSIPLPTVPQTAVGR
ncbi:MAG TPA: sigma-70 family RNA polymerase sigma factor [Acidimicrobiales bacterium]|nr:sigma-70 family RNA polymerase sigma factor [Acidimicrobiales bacterium]